MASHRPRPVTPCPPHYRYLGPLCGGAAPKPGTRGPFLASRRRPRFPPKTVSVTKRSGSGCGLDRAGPGHRLPASPRRPGPSARPQSRAAGRQPSSPGRRGGAGTAPSGPPLNRASLHLCRLGLLPEPLALWWSGRVGRRQAAARTRPLALCHGLWRGRTFSLTPAARGGSRLDLKAATRPAAPLAPACGPTERGAPWQPPTSRRHDCTVARGWMHPLIGSSAAAAQEPPTSQAPPPPISPLNSLTGYRGMCFRFPFFFFFPSLWSQVCSSGPLLQDTLKTVIIISTPMIVLSKLTI